MPQHKTVFGHTPHAHVIHVGSGRLCGCVEDVVTAPPGNAVLRCPICDAAYFFKEVAEFRIFRCYDCAVGFWICGTTRLEGFQGIGVINRSRTMRW